MQEKKRTALIILAICAVFAAMFGYFNSPGWLARPAALTDKLPGTYVAGNGSVQCWLAMDHDEQTRLYKEYWEPIEVMFGDENAMIRIDMSEYMEKHTVSRLVGSPPGYVGHEEGGQLTEKVRRKPYSVVLFDEIEKAHPDVWNILLQILEDGIVTDSQGRRVDFKNTIIVMTSNVGAKNITAADTPLGFDGSGEAAKRTEEERFARIKDAVMAELRQTFRPEFLNRIDEIIVFHQLTEENIRSIARRMLDTIGSRMAAQGITLQADDDAVAALAKDGFDARYGARPLRRTLQNEVEDVVAEQMLDGQLKSGDTAHIRLKDDKVVIEK